MTESICRAVHDLWSRRRDDALSPLEQERIDRHLAACATCRRTAELRGLISPLADEAELDPLARRRLEVAIRTRRAPSSRRAPLVRPLPALGLALGAAAVFALGLLVGLGGRTGSAQAPRAAVSAAPKDAARPTRVAAALPEAPRTIEVVPGTSLWMDRGARLEALRTSAEDVRYALRSGRIVVSIGPHAPGFRFAVETPRAEIEAHGTVFSIAVDGDGGETIRVAESAVDVRLKPSGERTTVRKGQQLIVGRALPEQADGAALAADLCAVRSETCAPDPAVAAKARPIKARAMAAIDGGRYDEAESLLRAMAGGAPAQDRLDVLTRIARAYRQAGMYDLAAATYARLGREFPDSDAAVGGLVALAQLEQGPLGDPGVALGHFEGYLAARPNGVLAETARAGVVRSLLQLRRFADAVRAADAYLAAYPDGLAAEEIRRRRDEATGSMLH
jgi:hypothetical protein